MPKQFFIILIFSFIINSFHSTGQEIANWNLINEDIFYDYYLNAPERIVFDVRYKDEYRFNRIPGAILVHNKAKLAEVIVDLDFEQPILIYCHFRSRCVTVADLLVEKGFDKVFILETGIEGWIKKDYPFNTKKIRKRDLKDY